MSTEKKNRRERGQTLVLVAFSIITLVAFVGLGVDLGLAYVEKVRVQRAADAAALAAAAELPVEASAQLRALEYLSENSYDCNIVLSGDNANCTDPDVYVKINDVENFPYDPGNPSDTKIEIDTESFAETQGNTILPNSASRIRVRVTQQVQMYFMRLLGINQVAVAGVATAENIKDLDVVLVFDTSGSMEFDTLCYGCWTPNNDDDVEYPDGYRWPLRWDGPYYGPPAHCAGDGTVRELSGDYYMIIEAEEYSSLSNNDYSRDTRPGQGYTYWVMQRNGSVTGADTGYLGDSSAYGRDSRGAYIAHFPYVNGFNSSSTGGGAGVPCSWTDLNNGYLCRTGDWIANRGGPYPAPRVDYDFTVPADGNATWYIWIRAQGGDTTSHDPNRGQGLFWGLTGGSYGSLSIEGFNDTSTRASGDNGWHYNGAEANSWSWRRLRFGSDGRGASGITLAPGESYTLHLWAGSVGYAVDRIVITEESGSLNNNATKKGSTYLDNNRTDWACDPCDVRFGGSPDGLGNTSADGDDPPRCDENVAPGLNADFYYRYNDDLFDDEQPIASTAASAVRFIRKLDFKFDQIGLVRYDSSADPAVELLCLKSNGAGCTKNVIENTMLSTLMSRNSTRADGSTNIADGLEEAIQMMDNSPPHYGRPSAAHVIILMTDGQPTACGSLRQENRDCDEEDLWPGNDANYDCAMYMARKARNEGIIIYGITLGEGADKELLEAISEMTGGINLHADDPRDLDRIFDELYNRIFLRLVE